MFDGVLNNLKELISSLLTSGSQNIAHEYQFKKQLHYNKTCPSVAGKAYKQMTTLSEYLSKRCENGKNQVLDRFVAIALFLSSEWVKDTKNFDIS